MIITVSMIMSEILLTEQDYRFFNYLPNHVYQGTMLVRRCLGLA
jgi:hypothetical protein